MRRFALAVLGSIAAMAVATTTAGASFDPHFTVITTFISGEERNGAFHFKFRVLDELDHSDTVGNGTGRCRQHKKIRCRAELHLNGEVGGRGDLVVKGNEGGGGDTSFLVVDGSGDFGGVAGKMVIQPEPGDRENRFHFDLVR